MVHVDRAPYLPLGLQGEPYSPDRGRSFTGSIITQVMTNARDRRTQRVAFLKQQLEQF